MFKKLPNWQAKITATLLTKILNHPEIDTLHTILTKANEEYLHWNKFKYLTFPKDLIPEEVWVYFKFKYRMNSEETMIKSVDTSHYFTYNMTKKLYKGLSFIDTYSTGFISSLSNKPSASETDKLIISGLTEEAIASSQIEGANTTRKLAKEMLISGRPAKNRDEQMIINTYKVMSNIEEWRYLDLSKDMLLEMQTMITKGTLQDKGQEGRFRKDIDEIVIQDAITGEIAHTPPSETIMMQELDGLIIFANTKESEHDFLHPVLKAIILHFWIAYLHPFADGNGRTARAVFYWYLRKNNYWMFKYLAVSRAIKKTRTAYDKAYLHSEHDDNDLTYFILYNIKAISTSITDLLEYYEKTLLQSSKNKQLAYTFTDLNQRQIELLQYVFTHPNKDIDIETHKNTHMIAYETARKDLQTLTKKGFFTEFKKSHKKIYVSNKTAVSKLLQASQK